jgi:hypothetical protein
MPPSVRRKAASISSWAILRICFFCRSVKAGRRPRRLPFFLRALRGIGDFLVRFIMIFLYGVASQSAQSEEEKEAMGAALGAPRSSSAFDSPHQRPAYNRIMARAGWKSFAFVQHNLVVAGIATINPAAVVTVSASLHNFLFRRRFSRILACPTMGRIGGGYAAGERFSLNPRGKALPFTCEHRVPTSVECLSRRDPGSVS